MEHDLIERYLYAATRRLSPRIRNDVKAELGSLIDDMIAERCGENKPTEKDIRVILTELGTPQALYAKYMGDGDTCLIGQPYYSEYASLIGKLPVIVALAVPIIFLCEYMAQPVGLTLGLIVESILETIIVVGSVLFTAITLFYAICQRKGKIPESYNLDDLPSVPSKREEISRAEGFVGTVLCLIGLVVLVFMPQFIAIKDANGTVIPVFGLDVLRNSWLFVLIMAGIECGRYVVRIVEGRYNRKVMISTLLTNAIGAAAAAILFTRPGLINPELVSYLSGLITDENAGLLRTLVENLQPALLVIFMIGFVADSIETVYRTLKK